jgi:DNA-binding transcriptional regulator YiaG
MQSPAERRHIVGDNVNCIGRCGGQSAPPTGTPQSAANDERSEAVKAGQDRARASGHQIGRPKRVFDRAQVVTLRDQDGLSRPAIACRMGVGVGTAVRAYQDLTRPPEPSQNYLGENP